MLEGMRDVQRQVYQWRKDFFESHFYNIVDRSALPWVKTNWITYGGDDSHFLDTIPYNVTQNFEVGEYYK